jgi:hypothetical protein
LHAADAVGAGRQQASAGLLMPDPKLATRGRLNVSSHPSSPPKLNRYPLLAPRFWHGMVVSDWLRLVSRNRFRVHPIRWSLAFTVSCAAVLNSLLRLASDMRFARDLAASPGHRGILFIIGHWRSGTTLLHELLVLDDRFAYPTTYECFAANHFLLSGGWMPKLIWFLLPARRPMDDMEVSFDHPQEDEFALISMGAPSPLLRMAFPNHPPPYLEFLDMEQVRDEDLRCWKQKLARFVAMQTLQKQKPLVLKSPTHTGRLQILSEMFPDAKFIHITRNPYELFSSTVRLWTVLDEAQSFQWPREDDLEEYVFTAFERMYRGFERQRHHLPGNCICDVRYEDLIQEPVETLQTAYERLELGGFERLRPKIEQSMQRRQGHRPNRHELPARLRAKIEQRWADYFKNYGYAISSTTADHPLPDASAVGNE